ncbi:S41 family peptidase [Litoribacter populi]|uniref:S41 family peptidase n=1 Tax=Litoribacter populi TaxID=2598460 RepID=UPI00117EE819|nr:S41 family peptidase [Litoribacter populi]
MALDIKFTFLLLILFAASILDIKAQSHATKLTEEERAQVVEEVSQLLRDNYIFPEVAEEMAELIKEGLKNNYKSLEWPQEFAECLTEDLRSISNDRHLSVIFEQKPVMGQNSSGSPDAKRNYLDNQRRDNFGFKELKILDGNIGYLNLKGFVHADFAKETAVAAMNFLANADAVIIDLRENGGGSPTMIQLISSYFFKGDPIHLNTFYNRPNDETWETWTLEEIPGKRMPDVDLYILTSNYTFSAAEEFAYNLRHLNRATIVGETTGGGAHPVQRMVVADRFMISLPTGRAINPITKTNWEGVGVEPHMKVESDEALLTAQIMALETLAGKASPETKKLYEWHLTNFKAQEEPLQLEGSQLVRYTGVYGPREVTVENGKLFYKRSGSPKFELIPLDRGLFGIKDMSNFRVKFHEENNEVKAMTGIYLNGNEETYTKGN